MLFILKSLYFLMCLKCCFHGYFIDLGDYQTELNYVVLGIVLMVPMLLIDNKKI
jgi:hypothetical protein